MHIAYTLSIQLLHFSSLKIDANFSLEAKEEDPNFRVLYTKIEEKPKFKAKMDENLENDFRIVFSLSHNAFVLASLASSRKIISWLELQ